MTERTYEFTVLRIVPNAMRGERVNVGLAVFDPDGGIDLHLDANKNRLCSFDPNLAAIDWDDWQAQVRHALGRMPASGQAYWLAHGLHPVTADQARGSFRADVMSYGDQVEDLLHRLVTIPAREISLPRRPTQVPSLRTQWRKWFKGQHLMGKGLGDMANHQIVESYPVSSETNTFAEFAFKNGAIHIIETLDLRNIGKLNQRHLNNAAFKSIVLDEAKTVVAGGGQRIAVFSATDYKAVRPAVKIFERMADDLVSMESNEDVDRLVTHIGRALHRPDALDASPLLASNALPA